MDVAFSRDRPEKIYVQHRMWDARRDLVDWIENGAYFYVCGDASRMARDVDAALKSVVARQGGMSDEEAQEYVSGLVRDKRYVRDVY